VNVFLTIVYADFETAIHTAVKTVCAGCEVKACRLHLVQSWRLKTQSLGLSKQYGRNNSGVSQFLKKIFGLSLLPRAEVSDSFALDFISNLPNDKRVEQFCDYLLENYVATDSTFPPPVCSECFTSSLRTPVSHFMPISMHCLTVRILILYFCSCICTAENTE
jgi:hypothetical protein